MTASPPKLRARYIGYTTGTDNHGDEALLWILRDLLAPEIEVVFDGPDYDIALLGGGTLINQSPWLIDVFGAVLEKAGRGLVIGTGVGDLYYWGDHFDRWEPLLRQCEYVGVRGPESLKLLNDHGISHAQVIGDPYLWLRCPVERNFINKRLGVNIGSTNNSLWGTNDRDLAMLIGDALKSLKADGWSFTWISVWEKDKELIEIARAQIGDDAGPVLDARSQTLECYSAIAACELFMGEKLHANAMAAVAGVPFIGLEYQPKVRDFAASIGMDSWIVSTAERDKKKLIGAIENLRTRRAEERDKMIRERDMLRDRLIEFVGSIKKHYGLVPRELEV